MEIETNIANYDLSISYGYHLHEAGMYEKSYSHNKSLAEYATKIGDLDQAETSYRTAIDDAKKLNKTDNEKDTLFELTNKVLMLWGRYDEALSNYQNLKRYFSRIRKLKLQSEVLRYIGEIHARRRDSFFEALANLQKSLDISENLKDQLGIARTLHEMGNVFRKKGQYDNALDYYKRSLSIKERFEDKKDLAVTLHEMGNVFRKKGDYDNALDHYNRSLTLSEQLDEKRGIARTKHEIGNVYQQQGKHYRQQSKYEDALEEYKQSLEIQTQIGNQIGIARSCHEIGNINRVFVRYEEALMWYERSLEIKRPLKVRYDIAITVLEIGSVLIDEEKYDDGLPFTIEAHLLLENLKDPLDMRASSDLDRLRKSIGVNEYNKRYYKIARQIKRRHRLEDPSYRFR